jgi:hypothetical protein
MSFFIPPPSPPPEGDNTSTTTYPEWKTSIPVKGGLGIPQKLKKLKCPTSSPWRKPGFRGFASN